jgi:hypothetical protein
MKKLVASIALGAASLALVAQPAVAAPPTTIFPEVGGALEAHSIAPCEPQDWTSENEIQSAYASSKLAREERDRGVRLVMAAGRPCPEPDAFASETDWREAFNGLVAITVYKTPKLRERGMKHYNHISRFVYAYGRLTLIHLGPYPSRELTNAFVAAMKDLHARRVSEYKLD